MNAAAAAAKDELTRRLRAAGCAAPEEQVLSATQRLHDAIHYEEGNDYAIKEASLCLFRHPKQAKVPQRFDGPVDPKEKEELISSILPAVAALVNSHFHVEQNTTQRMAAWCMTCMELEEIEGLDPSCQIKECAWEIQKNLNEFEDITYGLIDEDRWKTMKYTEEHAIAVLEQLNMTATCIGKHGEHKVLTRCLGLLCDMKPVESLMSVYAALVHKLLELGVDPREKTVYPCGNPRNPDRGDAWGCYTTLMENNEAISKFVIGNEDGTDIFYDIPAYKQTSERCVWQGDRLTGRWHKAEDVYWRYKDSKVHVENEDDITDPYLHSSTREDQAYIRVNGEYRVTYREVERAVGPLSGAVQFRQPLEILKESNPLVYAVVLPFISAIRASLTDATKPRMLQQETQTQFSMDDLENSFRSLSIQDSKIKEINHGLQSLRTKVFAEEQELVTAGFCQSKPGLFTVQLIHPGEKCLGVSLMPSVAFALSGWGKRSPPLLNSKECTRYSQQLARRLNCIQGHCYDRGDPGKYFASHTERLLFVETFMKRQPEESSFVCCVNKPVCDQCRIFFRKITHCQALNCKSVQIFQGSDLDIFSC